MTDSGQIESNFKVWLDGQRTDCNRPIAAVDESKLLAPDPTLKPATWTVSNVPTISMTAAPGTNQKQSKADVRFQAGRLTTRDWLQTYSFWNVLLQSGH
jgi:hypothetical protein